MTEQEIVAALARAEACPPGPYFVHERWGVCRGVPGDDSETYPLDDPAFDEFAAHARQDVPSLARLALDLLQWRSVWEQDSGYHEGVMAERRRVLGEVRGMMRPESVPLNDYYQGAACALRDVLLAIGPAPEKLPALPPDRTREMLARAVELLSSWVCIRQSDLGRLTRATVELLKEAGDTPGGDQMS